MERNQRKQSTRWQHISGLKASAFFSLQKNFSCYETQQLILGAGTAIWWVPEPHCPELLFLFLKGMTGALAPFSYLVFNIYSLSDSRLASLAR
jgi:hypothetical protein